MVAEPGMWSSPSGQVCGNLTHEDVTFVHTDVIFPLDSPSASNEQTELRCTKTGTPVHSTRSQTDKMRRLLRIVPVVLLSAGVALFFERPAYAYVDPDTGLLAVQVVGSAMVATGWYLRRKISAFLHLNPGTKREPEEISATRDEEGAPLR